MRVEVRDRSGDLIWAFWSDGSAAGGVTSRSYAANGTLEEIARILGNACRQACGERPDDGLREEIAALFGGFVRQRIDGVTGEAADLIADALRESDVRAQVGSRVAASLHLNKGMVQVTKQGDSLRVVAGMDGENMDGAAVAEVLSKVGASAVAAIESQSHVLGQCKKSAEEADALRAFSITLSASGDWHNEIVAMMRAERSARETLRSCASLREEGRARLA